jgi:Spy/CpxP family protein refolding chaperone
MEEVFKQLAESLSKFKGIDKIAEEGMRSINTAVKGLDLTKEQRQQIEDAKNEVSTQLKEYKKKCQLLSQIEVSEG